LIQCLPMIHNSIHTTTATNKSQCTCLYIFVTDHAGTGSPGAEGTLAPHT